nr:hypothetical protein [Tanacetum cinerariifolium]
MTSFGYRFTPRYTIKECSSCGTLYTRDCVCSKGNVEDKILVPKPPKNCVRCTRCGHPVDGPNFQGCALLRHELEETLVTHSQHFQNTSEPSNENTNVVNAPREPCVFKQDHGSFVDKIIFYLNRAPDSPHPHTISPNQFRCFHYKDVLGDGEACKRCTCAKCGSGLSKGLCYIYGNNQNSLNASPSISEISSQSPPPIHHYCYECGDPLDGTMLIMVTIVHLKLRLSIRSRVTIKTLISHKIFKMFHNNTLVVMITGLLMTLTNLNSTLAKLTKQMTSFTSFCEMACQILQKKQEEKQLEEEQAAKAQNWKLPVCYDDDYDEERSDSLKDNIISGLPPCFAITPNEPVLSTEEPDNSLSMRDEHLDTISAMESDELIKSSVENLIPIPSESEDYVEASPLDSELVSSEVMEIVIPEVGGIDDDILLTIKDDILREKLLNVNLLIAKIKALDDNPTPSSDCKTKSSSTSLNSLLEETNTSDNSLPEFEKYEVFYDDHVKEISSGSPTTHSDSSFYASFIFDLSINPFPPADRSDFYEFTDELIPFISPLKYDCFHFKVEPNSRDFTKDVVKDISLTKEPQVHNALPTHPSFQLNMKFHHSSEYLFTYVVWIFLPFLVYSVAPHYLLTLRNEDTIFDPGI